MSGQRNIRLLLAYDGTEFAGWAAQKQQRTVQGVLEKGLERMHGHPVRTTVAGRTDSGVHASGQVVNIHSDLASIPGERFARALNSYLPADVRLLASREVAPGFDARRSALARTYRYQLFAGDVAPPHLARYSHQPRRRLDLGRLNRLAATLVGDHDYSAFCAAGDTSVTKRRIVTAAVFFADGPFVAFRVTASSFLWRMVRCMVGTLLELEGTGAEPAELTAILACGDRSRAGETAPAAGLFLEHVTYPEPQAAAAGYPQRPWDREQSA